MNHEIIQLIVTGHDNFIHLIADRNSGEAAVVDPAWDYEAITAAIGEQGLTLTTILLTHTHYDHVNAVAALYQGQVSLFLSEAEYPCWPDCPQDAILLGEGDRIPFGGEAIRVIMTPGHTPGGCCYHIGDDLITGDTLFVYGCGRADLPGGDARQLFHSLQKLKRLPPQTRIWVGHHYGVARKSTIGEQLAHNPFLMIDNETDFIRYRRDIAGKTRKAPYGPIGREALADTLGNG